MATEPLPTGTVADQTLVVDVVTGDQRRAAVPEVDAHSLANTFANAINACTPTQAGIVFDY
jgi:hypothetical protein